MPTTIHESKRFFRFKDANLRTRMNFGHSRPTVAGLEIMTRGYRIPILLAQGKIVDVTGFPEIADNEPFQTPIKPRKKK